ncbi:MAG: uroporphyrinogen decarboxylase family protein [Spirochaetota bacterium]
MTEKAELVRRVLTGDKVERIPYSLWTHFPGIDLDPERLAETTAGFCREFDLDFVKTMSNGLFSIEDWDCDCDYGEIASGGVAKVTRFAVNEPEDWDRLGPLDLERGALARELSSLRSLLAALGPETPILATVFSPLTTAQKLSGKALRAHLRSDPERVRQGLAVIAESTARFAARAVELGAAGVYFASQMSRQGETTEAEYADFGLPGDLEVLRAVAGAGWFNVMHVHGDDIHFDLLKGYPVQGISWHVWETGPTIEDFLGSTEACVVGGLRRFKITEGDLPALQRDVAETTRLTGGKRLFLAPGCVIRYPYDRATLRFVRDAIFDADSRGD